MSLIDRAYGSLLGLMVGDAFGAQVEGTSGAMLKELFPFGIQEMGSRIRSFEGGTVTDDSEMALLMAASLVANDG
ncbi:MAG TPA: ADP-ribosylglycohydrolase family protein, partial [Sphaerochaeta sp.]|nr:ADP-ribosylglycohydrolase family protein [Sphaerochaeta sp.]